MRLSIHIVGILGGLTMINKQLMRFCFLLFFSILLSFYGSCVAEDCNNTSKDCDCYEIDGVIFCGDTLVYYPEWKEDTEYIIPNHVKRIGKCAFDNTTVKYIYMYDNVIEIGENAFEGCTSLEAISLSKNLSCIRANAFLNCSSLINIVFPESLYCIGQQAFSESGLSGEIYLPASLLYVGDAAFYLTNIDTVIFGGDIEYADDIFYEIHSQITIVCDQDWSIGYRLSEKYGLDCNVVFVDP